MRDEKNTKAGYEVLREKERLERLRPELVSQYQSFLKSFAQFRETRKQFEEPPKKAPSEPVFAARLK